MIHWEITRLPDKSDYPVYIHNAQWTLSGPQLIQNDSQLPSHWVTARRVPEGCGWWKDNGHMQLTVAERAHATYRFKALTQVDETVDWSASDWYYAGFTDGKEFAT